ncbi:MAG: hypothetical protein M3088_05115 [Actinomycetota bacterium]|nr:hypothetical protein [Actinomycetota bacterium]
MSRRQRLAFLAVAAVIAVVAAVTLRLGPEEAGDNRRSRPTQPAQTSQSPPGSGRDERRAVPPEARYETIRFEDGRPVGGVKDIAVESGETVGLALRSDRAEEIHIHGYDRYLRVEPGEVERIRFPARLEGVFEIEAHWDGTLLARLRVEP